MKKILRNAFALMMACGLCQIGVAQVECSYGPSIPTVAVGTLQGGTTMNNYNNFMSQVSVNQSYAASTQSLYSSTAGSPYLFEDFQEGIVVKNNDMAFDGIQLNFDAFTGDVVAINKKGDKIALDERYYKKVVIKALAGDVVFVKANPKKSDRFVQVLYDDNGIVFFKDPKVSIREGRNNGVSDSPDKFVLNKKYYVVKDGGEAIAVNLKKQDLFDHFPEIQMVAFNEVVKKKKIKLKNEADYVSLFSEF